MAKQESKPEARRKHTLRGITAAHMLRSEEETPTLCWDPLSSGTFSSCRLTLHSNRLLLALQHMRSSNLPPRMLLTCLQFQLPLCHSQLLIGMRRSCDAGRINRLPLRHGLLLC